MLTYIGTKVVNAHPMNRRDYNAFRGWQLPADENGDDEGYLVEYTDGGKPNTSQFAGYVSWSPREQFERAYRDIARMDFGGALTLLKAGKRVARRGWNGAGMWLSLTEERSVQAEHFWSRHNAEFAARKGGHATVQAYITMKTAQDMIVPWLASQSDMLAEDWMEVL